MIEPSKELQFCLGVSCCLLSFGGMWSMVTGANVKGGIAGAHFSVNEKLEAVNGIRQELKQTTQQLKNEPSVSRLKIKEIEKNLEKTEQEIKQAESEVNDNLNELIEPNEPH